MGFFLTQKPDVLCLQEVRAHLDQFEFETPEGYHRYWYMGERKGYSGTAIFTKQEPLSVAYGMGKKEHDQEGRVITLEFKDHYLVNVYTPNSKRELDRLDYRQVWDEIFYKYLKKLEKKKPVVFCGDLNVAHKEIDLANPSANRRNAGFTDEERAGFDRFVDGGFIDTFREFCDEGGHYTWWSNFANSRARNIGWRIDYFCISPALRSRLKEATIEPKIKGSDHCPVTMVLK